MGELSGLGSTPPSLLPTLLMQGFFLWLILSVIAVTLYRLFRGRPDGVTSEFVVLEPKKKKRE
jgi:hypothetical protein